MKRAAYIVSLIVVLATATAFVSADTESGEPPAVQVSQATYHGWLDAVVLRNKQAEAVIVPAIGRIMSFKLLNADAGNNVDNDVDEDSPIWNNRRLDGKPPDPHAGAWLNFGGDKTWPAPQDDWPEITGRAWPPPAAFDATAQTLTMPGTAELRDNQIAVASVVDQSYGIRIRRVITLSSGRPRLTVDTTYEKIHGSPVTTSVWVITQLRDPERVYALVPLHSRLTGAFTNLGHAPPFGLKRQEHLISIARDPDKQTKIGSAGDSLLWVGKAVGEKMPTLRIQSQPLTLNAEARGGKWPDKGSHVEIYTNPGSEQKYVELETLGPLTKLTAGQSIGQRNVYTLKNISKTDLAGLRDTEP